MTKLTYFSSDWISTFKGKKTLLEKEKMLVNQVGSLCNFERVLDLAQISFIAQCRLLMTLRIKCF